MSKFTTAAATSHTLSLHAMEEASRRGQRTAGVDHMLVALVINEQPGGQVLREMGITLESARAAVLAQHATQLASLGVTNVSAPAGRIVFHETGGYEWNQQCLEILKRATSNKKRGDAAAVLRELVTEPSGLIEEVLSRLDTTPEAIVARLDEVERYPAHPTQQSLKPGRLSGSSEAFVPASAAEIWEMLATPERMHEWDPSISAVDAGATGARPARPGDTWTARVRTQRPDGKPIAIKPQFQLQQVQLVARAEPTLIEWQFSYPEAPRANSRRIRVELEPAAGGTQLRISLAWERTSSTRRPFLGLLVRPFYRLVIWMQLSSLSAGISRAFRSH